MNVSIRGVASLIAVVIGIGLVTAYTPTPADAAYRVCKSISASGARKLQIHAHKAALVRLAGIRQANARGGYRPASAVSSPSFRRAGANWVATVRQRLCKHRQ
jgi:hypothetical protein